MNTDELKELASQLCNPHGKMGLDVADMMHQTNSNMTKQAIERLELEDYQCVLELGHGSCKHLPEVLNQAKGLTYYGLETSQLMHIEAQRIQQAYIEQKQAQFFWYDGEKLPFKSNHFERIFTVNTIYFWNNPQALLAELYRVLKPGGLLNITFAQKESMEQLPFTRYDFTLYDNEKLTELVRNTTLTILCSHTQSEMVYSKSGDQLQRNYTTFTLIKQ